MLSHKYRLKKNYQFNYVYKKGVKVSGKYIMLVRAKKKGGVLIGFSVSNKIGNAVVRNKVKRRLRHAVRGMLASFENGYSYILVAKTGIDKATYGDILKEIERLLGRVKQ